MIECSEVGWWLVDGVLAKCRVKVEWINQWGEGMGEELIRTYWHKHIGTFFLFYEKQGNIHWQISGRRSGLASGNGSRSKSLLHCCGDSNLLHAGLHIMKGRS